MATRIKSVEKIGRQNFRVEKGRVALDEYALFSYEKPKRRQLPQTDVGSYKGVVNAYRLIGRFLPSVPALLPFAHHIPERGDDLGFVFSSGGGMPTRLVSARDVERNVACHPWATILREFVRQRRKIDPPPEEDELQAHLMDLRYDDRGWTAEIGPGRWQNAYSTMDAAEVMITGEEGDPERIRRLVAFLEHRVGTGKKVREAVVKDHQGMLPPFGTPLVQYSLGVGGDIFCERDGKFVVTRRRPDEVHINPGIVYSAGGGVTFLEAGLEPPVDLFNLLDAAMRREQIEEIGEGPFTLERAGFFRELPRLGSPEFFYLIRFPGTVEDLLNIMAANEHPDSREVDGFVYAIQPEDVFTLLQSRDGTNVIQQKGLALFYWVLKRMGLL